MAKKKPEKRQTILFRVDGNPSVGLGHVMRCLSIADAAKSRNIESLFVSADDSVASLVKKRGFCHLVLGTDYRNLIGEVNLLNMALESTKVDLIVVDSYYATNTYFDKLRLVAPVAYLDDFGRERFSADVIINYNVSASAETYELLYGMPSSATHLILGSRFAPLRKQFIGSRALMLNKSVENIMVLVGGSDKERMALRLAKGIGTSDFADSEMTFHFVLGSMDPDLDTMLDFESRYEWLVVKIDVDNMAGFMQSMDLAVSASGTTLYELCACGVPTINYCLSDDQIAPAQAFSQLGAMLFCGDYRSPQKPVDGILKAISMLCENDEMRCSFATAASRCVDGNGAQRIIGEFLKLGVIGR